MTIIDLSKTSLKSLPESINEPQNLTILYLSRNELASLSESIGKFQNLTVLDLNFNKLSSLPDSISNLRNLTKLHLGCNNFSYLPDSIGNLRNLTKLYLNFNSLSSLPESITRLENLRTLDLSSNQLTFIPDCVYELRSLEELRLENPDWVLGPGNEIKEISPKILQLTNLRELRLDGNPIEIPPPEVVAKGLEAIKDYFRELKAEATDYLYEAKLLIVGETRAGKTSLAKKILDQNYVLDPNEPETHGIDVIQWQFQMANGRPFRVNIWDFGGHEIYYETHQFFLTKRSLYLLVCDPGQQETHFYHWLNVVKLLSDSSPLFIVENQKQERKPNIPERQLRERFTNFKDTLATNLATKRGLSNILKQIQHSISALPHIGTALPKKWINVREALEEDSRNHISLNKYLEICTAHGFSTTKDALELSKFLHDLGVILHFQDEKRSPLYKTVILKPEWGTTAVYRVLDNQKVQANLGQFSWADLDEIWQEVKYANMQGELLELMLKFKLCYQIEQSQHYIAPQLLDLNQPDYEWDSKDNLLLRYTYEFMPKGIMTRFIVGMHELIWVQQYVQYVWRSGVILEKDQTKAEVIEHVDKQEIRIRIVGPYKKDLLMFIKHELDRIHNSFEHLECQTLIPCNCIDCKGSEKPHFYDFDMLRRFAKDGEEKQCPNSYQMVKARDLIDDIIPQKPTQHGLELAKPTNSPSSTAPIRRLLNGAFDETEFNNFCFDYFPRVYDRFSQGMGKHEKIHLLLDHCRSQPRDFNVLLNPLYQEYNNNPYPREELKPLIDTLNETHNKTHWIRLHNLLEEEKWKEADLETASVILKIANQQENGQLRSQDIKEFPCSALQAIDYLWKSCSNHRFGFTIQRRLWLAVVGQTGQFSGKDFREFGDRVGWRVDGDWLRGYDKLIFTSDAPEGHLPSLRLPVFEDDTSWWQSWQRMFQRFVVECRN